VPESQATVLVVLGAAVSPSGKPSGAMQRRIGAALRLMPSYPGCHILVTGGIGKSGYGEADIMRAALIEAGIPPERIWSEGISKDTLESVIRCATIIRDRGPDALIIPCTDRYHVYRCLCLFRLLGFRTLRESMPSGLAANGWIRWSLYYLKETIALPYDCLLLMARNIRSSR